MSGGVPAGELRKRIGWLVAAGMWGDDAANLYFDARYDGMPDIRRGKAMHTADRIVDYLATPIPPIEGRDADVERVEAPENGEKRPDWAEIKRAIDYFVGRVPTISKHRAINNAHIRAVVERLDAAGDREAADTIVWQCWYRALDAERERFLLADKDEQIAALQALGERG